MTMLMAISEVTLAPMPMAPGHWKVLNFLLRSPHIERVDVAACYIWSALQDPRKRDELRQLMLERHYHDPLALAVDSCTRAYRSPESKHVGNISALPGFEVRRRTPCSIPTARPKGGARVTLPRGGGRGASQCGGCPNGGLRIGGVSVWAWDPWPMEVLQWPCTAGGAPPPPPPPPDQSDCRREKRNLPLGKCDQAIVGTQTFGSQTPPPSPPPSN